MKKYKVGDTIYVKGTVADVDDTIFPYYVDFGKGIKALIASDNIVDELPTSEPVKPVLPKEVADELDIAKNKFQSSFDVYIENIIDSVSDKASYNYYLFNTNAIIKLADAWRYGYTVEKEKKYYVKVPHTKDVWYYWKKTDGGLGIDDLNVATADYDTDDFEFTESEIEHYGLQDCEKEEVTDDEQ